MLLNQTTSRAKRNETAEHFNPEQSPRRAASRSLKSGNPQYTPVPTKKTYNDARFPNQREQIN